MYFISERFHLLWDKIASLDECPGRKKQRQRSGSLTTQPFFIRFFFILILPISMLILMLSSIPICLRSLHKGVTRSDHLRVQHMNPSKPIRKIARSILRACGLDPDEVEGYEMVRCNSCQLAQGDDLLVVEEVVNDSCRLEWWDGRKETASFWGERTWVKRKWRWMRIYRTIVWNHWTIVSSQRRTNGWRGADPPRSRSSNHLWSRRWRLSRSWTWTRE